uniref:Secreted protein n=1 Tax=Knipowitschia caucasica TaxID=637954 RepID=A0AAV2MPU5_KNICA
MSSVCMGLVAVRFVFNSGRCGGSGGPPGVVSQTERSPGASRCGEGRAYFAAQRWFLNTSVGRVVLWDHGVRRNASVRDAAP